MTPEMYLTGQEEADRADREEAEYTAYWSQFEEQENDDEINRDQN